jgi:uncharacterized protein (TIGR02145 family)
MFSVTINYVKGGSMKQLMLLCFVLAIIGIFSAGCESIVDQDRVGEVFQTDFVPSNTITMDMCMNDPGWKALGYKNLGQCIRFVQSGTGMPPIVQTVGDIDGNEYPIVKIGDQWWMAENLRTTKYADGTDIPTGLDNSGWAAAESGAFAVYPPEEAFETDPDEDILEAFGALYNWYASTDPRGICPAGWHTPSDEEWKQLEMYLGMSETEADELNYRGTDEGGKMKSITAWVGPNEGATNESGFTALPGGYRASNGSFGGIWSAGYWWSSTEYIETSALSRMLSYKLATVLRYFDDKNNGFAVRCVKD